MDELLNDAALLTVVELNEDFLLLSPELLAAISSSYNRDET